MDCKNYLVGLLALLSAWLVVFLFLPKAKKKSESSPRKLPLPPGPSPLPIFGNLFSLGTKPHLALIQLSKIYGPLMSLKLGQVPAVVISSAAMAKEALHKNDLAFSHRMIIDAVRARNHHTNSVVWLPSVPQWRNLRKICNSHVFCNSKLEQTQVLRKRKVNDLLSYVQEHGKAGLAVDIGQAAFTTTLNLLSTTFFSVDLVDLSSGLACEFKDVVRGIMKESGTPNIGDYFPFLRKLDPQGIRRRTSLHFGKMVDLFSTMINQRLQGERASKLMQNNDVLDELLGRNQEKPAEIKPSDIPDLLVDLFTAGTDTTSITLEWAMAELLHNPRKLKKAQSELETIIGKGNQVEEHDISRLPYLQAVVKETLRLHPAAPLFVRTVHSDINLFDYTIPKNAEVFVNILAIGRDPEVWENPNSFEPERFLGVEIDVKGRDFELIPFGAGRRICPGLPLAIRMIHLMLGSLIHGFDWKLEEGVSPEEMDMEERFRLTLEKAQRLRAIPVPLCDVISDL